MDNIVGSCETKYWHKYWVSVKAALELNKEQRAMVVGSLLGDGTMRLGKKARNANFKIEHGLQQEEYVWWKYCILKDFVFTEPKVSFRYDENRMQYPKSWWFRTVRHPYLTDIFRQFYVGDEYRSGRKIIPLSITEELTPLGLAVWIMDDGSYNHGKIDISTYAFSIDEISLLQGVLKRKFHVAVKFYRDRDKGYRMYCNTVETQKLVNIIRPYIVPSMMYKIGFATP